MEMCDRRRGNDLRDIAAVGKRIDMPVVQDRNACCRSVDGDVDNAVGRDQPLLQIGQEGMLVPGRWNLDPEPARNAMDNISVRQMTHLANPVRFGAAERHLRVEYAGCTKAL